MIVSIQEKYSLICFIFNEKDCIVFIQGFSYGSGPHVVAFTSSGEIFTWGHNGYCELGNGSTAQLLVPTLLESSLANKVVVEVACGSHHTLALTSEGEVWFVNF